MTSASRRDELGDPVARGEPARVRDAEPEPGHQPALQLGAGLAPGRERADRAGELADGEPRLGLLDALEVAPDLRGPDRGLEAERDRQPRLAVRAAEHHRVAVALARAEQRGLGRAEVAPRDRQHALHHEPEPRVGDVLDGRAVVDPLGRLGPEAARAARGSARASSGRSRASRSPTASRSSASSGSRRARPRRPRGMMPSSACSTASAAMISTQRACGPRRRTAPASPRVAHRWP